MCNGRFWINNKNEEAQIYDYVLKGESIFSAALSKFDLVTDVSFIIKAFCDAKLSPIFKQRLDENQSIIT